MLIVGKEANGWGKYSELVNQDKLEAIAHLQQKYLNFREEGKWSHTPFWQGAHAIHKALNPASTDRSVMTTNLIRMNQNARKKRPQKDVEEIISTAFPVLKHEISILQPDVVIFFTGPYYDDRIYKTFNNAALEPVEDFKRRHFARVIHPDLPKHTYRTYHPGFSMRNREQYFNPVVDAIKRLTND